MKLKDIQEGDVIDFTGRKKPEKHPSTRLGQINLPPGYSVEERPGPRRGTDAPVGSTLDVIMYNVRGTIQDMIEDPENYGLEEADVENLSVERTLDVVGKILAGR